MIDLKTETGQKTKRGRFSEGKEGGNQLFKLNLEIENDENEELWDIH